jgi:hypothetical protein
MAVRPLTLVLVLEGHFRKNAGVAGGMTHQTLWGRRLSKFQPCAAAEIGYRPLQSHRGFATDAI